MAKNFIVTISGTPGSGKSTIAKALLKKIEAQRIYTGGLWRDLAEKKKYDFGKISRICSKES